MCPPVLCVLVQGATGGEGRSGRDEGEEVGQGGHRWVLIGSIAHLTPTHTHAHTHLPSVCSSSTSESVFPSFLPSFLPFLPSLSFFLSARKKSTRMFVLRRLSKFFFCFLFSFSQNYEFFEKYDNNSSRQFFLFLWTRSNREKKKKL